MRTIVFVFVVVLSGLMMFGPEIVQKVQSAQHINNMVCFHTNYAAPCRR